MAHEAASPADAVRSALRTFSRPWPTAIAGLILTAIALFFAAHLNVPTRLILMGVGLLLAAAAVSRRLQTASWQLEDRAESAGLLALAAFVALLAYMGMEESWDSGRLFLIAVITVALVGSLLVLLPKTPRRILIVLLVVLHFGGIVASITAISPRNDPPPWLAVQIWTRFYRPYLTFSYLTNAYHFYSPDPGPPTLLKFYIKYANGDTRELILPSRKDIPIALVHQRLLAAAESSTTQGGPPLLEFQIPEYEAKYGRPYELLPGIPHDSWETILKRRERGSMLPYKDAQGRRAPIQFIADQIPLAQYHEPPEYSRRLIASYARHVARTSPHPEDPSVEVVSVRVYRILHDLISPKEYSEGGDPQDTIHYKPIYVGKYDRNGQLLDPKDPFLFWQVPIARVSQLYPQGGIYLNTPVPPEWNRLLNCMEIHAKGTDKLQSDEE